MTPTPPPLFTILLRCCCFDAGESASFTVNGPFESGSVFPHMAWMAHIASELVEYRTKPAPRDEPERGKEQIV